MVQMQPAINRIKAKYFGDADTIADEESKLYKQYKYNQQQEDARLFSSIRRVDKHI